MRHGSFCFRVFAFWQKNLRRCCPLTGCRAQMFFYLNSVMSIALRSVPEDAVTVTFSVFFGICTQRAIFPAYIFLIFHLGGVWSVTDEPVPRSMPPDTVNSTSGSASGTSRPFLSRQTQV